MKKITLLFCFCLVLQYAHAHSTLDAAIAKNNIPVLPPPANDECSAATTLTVNGGQGCSSATTASFSGATTSAQPNSCTAATTPDIWFQFVAGSTAQTITLSNFSGTPQPVVLGLYEGSDCATMTQLYCSANNAISATGLTIGETYKLRAYFNTPSPSLFTTFSVCVSTPPPPSNNNASDCLIGTINYSFETPGPPAPTIYPTMVDHNIVQGWRTTASDQTMEFWIVPNYEFVPAYEGSQFIELNANLVSGVYQDYNTPQPTVFNYGFAHRGRQGTDTCELQAGPPGGPYVPIQQATTSNVSWVYYSGTYTVPAGQPVTRFILQSVSSVGGVSVGNYLDAITFTANNGILSDNPYYLNCGEDVAEVSAAGIGTWSAQPGNPSPTTIEDEDANNTEISGFLEPGTYYFDWTTEYCTSTLEVSYVGPSPDELVVSNVVYCQGQTAVPLEATPDPGNTIYWFTTGSDEAPIPSTATPGSTGYYVSQVAPSTCESIPVLITVTVNGSGASETDFTLPDSACTGDYEIVPTPAAGFTAGGEYTADDPGLVIDIDTGEIDMETSAPGDYTVTYAVEQNPALCILNSSSSTDDITIVAPPAEPVLIAMQPDCDSPTGSITVDSPLGANLNYSKDNGDTWQVSNVFSGLAAGSYTISVQNSAGCTNVADDPVVIDPAPVTPLVPNVSASPPGCNELTGAILVNSPNGPGLEFSLDGTTFQTEMLFSDVMPGTYTVTVRNAAGCETSNTPFVLAGTPPNPNAATTTTTPLECHLTGAISVTAPVGNGYQYSIDGTNFQTTTTFAGLAAGDYIVTTRNSFGCESVTGTITLDPGFDVPASANFDFTQPNCGEPDGSITITSPLGANLEYSIDGNNFQASTVFDPVAPGAHPITVRNIDSGCESANTPFVMPGAGGIPAIATYTVDGPYCGQTAAIVTITSPIAAGLSYSINGTSYQTSTVFNNVAPGNYTITVKNAAQCKSYTDQFTINQPPPTPPVPVVATTDPTCTVTTGTLTVTFPLGAEYLYSLDGFNYQPDPQFTVSAGPYTVYVQNTFACTASTTTAIDPAPGIPAVATVNVVSPACGETTGSITVLAPLGGGTTYSLDGGATTQPTAVFANLAPGDYTVTVINNSGCLSDTALLTIDIPPVAADQGVITGIDSICIDETTQLANTVTGGVWASEDNAVATVDAAGLVTAVSPGVATITYTVAGDCPDKAVLDVIVHALPAPELDDTFICENLETGEYGTTTLDSGLDTDDYTFVWEKGTVLLTETSGILTVDEPGDYTVTATSIVSGCVGEATATVGISSIAIASAEVGTDFHRHQSITVTVIGGSGDYEYQLDNGPFQDSPYFPDIYEGEYSITVRDKNGCGETDEIVVYALNFPHFFSPNGDGARDVWNIDGLRGQQNAVIYIFDRYGKIVGSAKPGFAGWDGNYEGAPLPATDYWFTIQYTSSNGQDKEFKAHFSLLR